MNCVFEDVSTKPFTLYNQHMLKEPLERSDHQINDYKSNKVGMFINAFEHSFMFCLAHTKKVPTSKFAWLNKKALESHK